MRTAKWMLGTAAALAALAMPWMARAEGLKTDLDRVPWPRWQARFALGVPAGMSRFGAETRNGVGSLSVMSDYYFARSVASGGVANGFRATGGLVVGPRSSLWTGRPALVASGVWSVDRRLFDPAAGWASGADVPGEASATLPYVGIGYSGLSPRGGWSVSADLGLMALAPANAVKLGRVVGGTQGLDELLRDLKLSPVIQVGVSYAF